MQLRSHAWRAEVVGGVTMDDVCEACGARIRYREGSILRPAADILRDYEEAGSCAERDARRRRLRRQGVQRAGSLPARPGPPARAGELEGH